MNEIERVNEETEDGNFVIELLKDNVWKYITTEFSISVSMTVANNLFLVTNNHTRVISRRSKIEMFCTYE